jgi:hypothetical protein
MIGEVSPEEFSSLPRTHSKSEQCWNLSLLVLFSAATATSSVTGSLSLSTLLPSAPSSIPAVQCPSAPKSPPLIGFLLSSDQFRALPCFPSQLKLTPGSHLWFRALDLQLCSGTDRGFNLLGSHFLYLFNNHSNHVSGL